MKNIFKNKIIKSALGLSLLLAMGCQRDLNELETATNPTNGDVFLDAFSSGLNYAAFGGSVSTAFDTDTAVKYSGTTSMKFAVPDYNDPNGAYAGGAFFTSAPRDLSGYNALTFWIKASQPASIDIIGLGNDLGANRYQASISGLAVNTNWKKVIIPIPDPSKLTSERGMLFYSEGPENNKGYTFWIDEVKFEKIGGLSSPAASILNGANKTATSFIGVTNTIDGFTYTANLPNGINQTVTASPYYFTFSSSNTAVATVNELGVVSTIGAGSSVVTATLGGVKAAGSLTLNSTGNFLHAPTPTRNASDVISVFSDAYTNVPVDYYNGYWAPYQTTLSSDFVVNNDHVLNYTNFNFVGTQFSSPTIDASAMQYLHLDLYLPNALVSGGNIKVQIVDFGSDGVFGGGNDTTGEYTIAAPALTGQSWVSVNIPFTSLTTLTSRSHLGQIVYVGTNVANFYADNVYFYKNPTIAATPTVAAPTPTYAAANVKSIFSDSYTNVAGTDFNPNWGQSTAVSQVAVAGNNTLKYAGLNYQGTQFASAQNVSSYGFLHIDYYSANSTSLKFYLISSGPTETPYTLTVPTTGTNGWNSIDIPLSAFSPVNLSSLIQFKVDGNGDIFFDNIYFHN